MADAVGHQALMGYVTRATWNDAYAAVNVAVPYTEEGLTSAFERIQNDALVGSAGRTPSYQGNEAVNGPTTHELNYENLHAFITALMGNDAAGTVTLTDLLAEYFAFEIDKQAARHRFWVAKANKITLSGEKGGKIMLAVDWNFRHFEPVGTAFPIAGPAVDTKVLFGELRFRIGTIAAGALSATDELRIESFEISLDRGHKADDYASDSDTTEVQQILEPLENDFRVCTLAIKTARYHDDGSDATPKDLVDWKDADSPLQAELYFDGPGTATQKWELPDMRISEGFDIPVGGPNVLTAEGSFECYRSSAGNPMYVGNEARFTYTT